LVVRVGGEGLGLLGGDGGVALDERSHHTSGGLDTEGEGSDVEQEKIGNFLGSIAGKDGGLDGGTVCDSLIRVDGLAKLLAVEEVLKENQD
jgi:hypothetical protein